VRAVGAPGHTPGHLVVAVASDGEQLLCTGDAMLHPVTMTHPEWYAAVDVEPDQAVAPRPQGPGTSRRPGHAPAWRSLLVARPRPYCSDGHRVPLATDLAQSLREVHARARADDARRHRERGRRPRTA
jgi:glyoxylase-like metal-dependent hydrolase (beta-lactamase superfamily II)